MKIDLKLVQRNALSGVLVSFVALPLAVGFGVAAFAPLGPAYAPMGAVAGLIGAIMSGFFASLAGGCPSQVTGPTGPMSVVARTAIATIIAAPHLASLPEDQRVAVTLFLFGVTVLLGGVVEVLLGVSRVGQLIRYIPYPVLAGFMNGVSILVVVTQIRPLLGVASNTPWSELVAGWSVEQSAVLVVGVVAALATWILPKFSRRLPGALLALTLGTALFLALGNAWLPKLIEGETNLWIVGTIPSVVPLPQLLLALPKVIGDLKLDLLGLILQQAVLLGLLGAIDTLLTSLIADFKTHTRHNSNRELMGQGLGNIISGLFGGLPGAGATVRTLVNIDNGGSNKIAGMVHALVLLSILVFLGPLARWIPLAALAGVLLVTAFKMIDVWSVSMARKRSLREDSIVLWSVTALTVAVDLVFAVAIGLALAGALYIKNQTKTSVIHRLSTGAVMRSRRKRSENQTALLDSLAEPIRIAQLEGSLFFGTADDFLAEFNRSLVQGRILILDLARVRSIDLTGGRLLGDLYDRVIAGGARLVFSGLAEKAPLRRFLQELGLAKDDQLWFPTLDAALEDAENTLLVQHDAFEHKSSDQVGIADFYACAGFDHKDCTALGSYLVRGTAATGDLLFEAGKASDQIWFIVSGQVEVFLQGQYGAMEVSVYTAACHCGAAAFIEQHVRAYGARVREELSFMRLDRAEFQRMSQQEPELALRLLGNLSHELAQRLSHAVQENRMLAAT